MPLEFDTTTKKNIQLWLDGQYDTETKQEIRRLLQENPHEILDAFFTNITFGTAGLRGLMGIGPNRMNVYTVRAASQGLANYMTHLNSSEVSSVFIGYDSRQHSRTFAEESAKVLAQNGIKVYLSKAILPTPLVSFGCREKKCTCAIMITASHNPAQYNGYKVYGADGGQIVPPHDKQIIAEVLKITDPTMVRIASSLTHPLIEEIGDEIVNSYVKTIHALQNYPDINRSRGKELKIVYTSLHGTGIVAVPPTLKSWGFTQFCYVEPQIVLDGTFPTVKHPNPEDPLALKMGIDRLHETQSDLLIATDPDADRIGVVVRQPDNTHVILNGNEIAAICLQHICSALSAQGRLSPKAAFIKSIVTTELLQSICDSYQRPCFNVLTGFKYIAEKIRSWEESSEGYQYIFGGEESYGYLFGTFVRDKDAVTASALLCEIALQAKLKQKTLIDLLQEIHEKHGLYEPQLLSLDFGDTKEGKEKMRAVMEKLRAKHLERIDTIEVSTVEDYLSSTKHDLLTKKSVSLQMPLSDVLLYWLKDGTKIVVRPSGTEPKIKIYCEVSKKRENRPLAEDLTLCKERGQKLLTWLKQHLS